MPRRRVGDVVVCGGQASSERLLATTAPERPKDKPREKGQAASLTDEDLSAELSQLLV